MRPIYLTRTLAAAVADGIAQAQNLAAPGFLTLNGSLVVAGVAQLGSQRKVLFTAGSGDDLSAINFVITGYNENGAEISETVVGPVDATPVSTVLDYSQVISIEADDAFPAAETVAVGTSGVGASLPIPLDQYISPFNVSLWLKILGTANATVQYTGDDVFSPDFASDVDAEWIDHSDLTGETADTVGTIISPVSAVRLVTNSGTGEVQLTVLQAGTGV